MLLKRLKNYSVSLIYVITCFCLAFSSLLAVLPKPAAALMPEDESVYTATNVGIHSEDDDCQDNLALPFSFDYYGTTYDTFSMSTNGQFGFGVGSTSCDSGFNDDDLSTGGVATNTLFPFWDDQESINSDMMYRSIGTPGSRIFIAQWTDHYHLYDGQGPMGTYQVLLFEATGKIQFQYRYLLQGSAGRGASATVGIRGEEGTYIQYSHHQGLLHSGQAISFTPDGHGSYTMDSSDTYQKVLLTDVNAPDTFYTESPANGVAINDTEPVFHWASAGENASEYRIVVSDRPDFEAGVFDTESCLTYEEVDDECPEGGDNHVIVSQDGIVDTQYDVTEYAGEGFTGLQPDTTYYWYVLALAEPGAGVYTRITDVSSFYTGADDDGVSGAEELAAPNDGDANNDEIADKDQANVTSFENPLTNEYSVLETNCDSNSDVQIGAESSEQPDAAYKYPLGLMGFTLNCAEPGATATVVQYHYGNYNPADYVARKWNSDAHSYTTIPGASITKVIIGGEPALRIEYQITDGGVFDQDGAEDGNIVDPSGPGQQTLGVPNTGFGGRLH